MIIGTSHEAEAVSPSFVLAFRFDPPFNLGAEPPPSFYLDICAVPNSSSVVKSILMNCSTQPVSGIVNGAIVGCSVQSVSYFLNMDSNFKILAKPINLCLRSKSLISQVFSFFGGYPTIPVMIYRFLVNPSPIGFLAVPQIKSV